MALQGKLGEQLGPGLPSNCRQASLGMEGGGQAGILGLVLPFWVGGASRAPPPLHQGDPYIHPRAGGAEGFVRPTLPLPPPADPPPSSIAELLASPFRLAPPLLLPGPGRQRGGLGWGGCPWLGLGPGWFFPGFPEGGGSACSPLPLPRPPCLPAREQLQCRARPSQAALPSALIGTTEERQLIL